MDKILQQPSTEEQIQEKSLTENRYDYAEIRGHKYKIRWMKGTTRSKITDVILTQGNDNKQSCQCAALMILNEFWAIKLKYWFLWRWFYYVKQYGEEELTGLLAIGKKKVPQVQYFTNTILLAELKDTNETMKKTEVATFLQERSSGQPSTLPKNIAG